jgi:hypothetical protein
MLGEGPGKGADTRLLFVLLFKSLVSHAFPFETQSLRV